MSTSTAIRDWQLFDHDRFLSNPEPEPTFAVSGDDPVVGIPPDHVVHDMELSGALAARPWHTSKPSEEDWNTIWDMIESYIGSVTVAICDTGCNKHNLLPTPLAMESFISGQSAFDGNGHGTHVSSTALGNDRRHGVAPGANLVVAKVLSNQGSGSSSGIASGIRWAVDWQGDEGQRVDVINLSLGGGSKYQPTIDAIKYGFSKGVLTNAAAGNSGPREATEGWPAKDPSVPSIGAMTESGNVATFSSRGGVLVATPGQQIIGASYRSPVGLVSMSGTSMATPFKCGLDASVIALRRASGLPRWRDNTPVMELYKRYAIDRGDPGWDSSWGYGVVDYAKLVKDMAHRGDRIFTAA